MSFADWSAPALAQVEGGGIRAGILLRIATDPAIRLWTGAVRDMAIPADNIEQTEGARYSSAGQLVGLPTISSLVNSQAERVEFVLSGAAVTGEVAAIASTEASDVRGAQVNLGWFVFDANWQKLSPVDWRWEGIADSLSVERSGDAMNATRTLKLSVGSLLTGRRRPTIGYFTDSDQRRRSADDAFFSEIRKYSSASTKVWPF